MELGDDLTDESVDMLACIDVSACRMHELIGGILEFAQLDAAPPAMSNICLTEVVHGVVAELSDDMKAGGATVTVGDLPTVYGHPALLHNIFHNILGTQ